MTLRAERDLPSYRVQAPHFTDETMPNRLNGMSEVARLLSDVDGNRTCGPLVKCSFRDHTTLCCSMFAKKHTAEIK